MPRVSVILTTYNRPEFLQTAIDSVLAQTFTDWELFVVDDNSNILGQEVVLSQIKDKRITVIKSSVAKEDRQKTTRYATLINETIPKTKGEFVTYLCDDDFYLPQRLELMVKFFDEHPEASVVYGSQTRRTLRGEEVVKTEICQSKEVDDISFYGDHSSFMHRRSIFEKTGYWDDSPAVWQAGDAAFFKRIAAAGYKFYAIPEVTDVHIYHDDSYCVSGRYVNL